MKWDVALADYDIKGWVDVTDFMRHSAIEYMNYAVSARRIAHPPPCWLFRGVRDANFDLIPSIGRPDTRVDTFSYSLEDERALFAAFKNEARPYLSYQPTTELEWLAVAQHHGVPTRLLDWTESFLTALYFAVAEGGAQRVFSEKQNKFIHREVAPAVYMTKGVPFCAPETDPFKLTEVRAYTPPHISPQIPAQRSILTIHPKPNEPVNYPDLKKLTIEPKFCVTLKMTLAHQGITYGSLFPVMHGLATQLCWDYKWNLLAKYHRT